MAVECVQCKAQNLEDKKYCGDCGAPLDLHLHALKQFFESNLHQQIETTIKEQYKDQKLVEFETIQAIASKLSDWTKLLGFFVGIPVALLILLLGFLGIKSYSDFSNRIESTQRIVNQKLDEAQKKASEKLDEAQKKASEKLDEAQKKASEIQKDADALIGDYQKLKAQLADASRLAKDVETLTEKVNKIEEKVGFTSSSKLTPEMKKRLTLAINKFQTYLKNLGYKPPMDSSVEIDIREEKKMPYFGMIAEYDKKNNRMIINTKYTKNLDLIYEQYTHLVLTSKESIPSDYNNTYLAIEYGLASYFPCSFNDNPQLTIDKDITTFNINLANKRRFNEVKQDNPDTITAQTLGAELWGGGFWDIRQQLGQPFADKLLFQAWFKFGPDEARTERGAKFVKKLLEMDKALGDGKHMAQIRTIFETRGLALEKPGIDPN